MRVDGWVTRRWLVFASEVLDSSYGVEQRVPHRSIKKEDDAFFENGIACKGRGRKRVKLHVLGLLFELSLGEGEESYMIS